MSQRLVGGQNELSFCQASSFAPDGALALAAACIRSVCAPHLERTNSFVITLATFGAWAGCGRP